MDSREPLKPTDAFMLNNWELFGCVLHVNSARGVALVRFQSGFLGEMMIDFAQVARDYLVQTQAS